MSNLEKGHQSPSEESSAGGPEPPADDQEVDASSAEEARTMEAALPRSGQFDGVPPQVGLALSMLADGLLAGLLAVLLLRSLLPSRPLALPTGASSAGVILLGVLAFACGVTLSVRGRLLEHGPRWWVDGLLAGGTVLIASLIVLPVLGVDLPTPTLALGVLGLGCLFGAATVALSDRRLVARRGVGAVVDGVLAVTLWYGVLWHLLPALAVPTPTGTTWSEVVGALLLLSVCSAVVRVPLEAYDGRSLGKRIAGVRVVDASGEEPGVRGALVRNLVRPIDSLPVGYLVGVGMLIAGDTGARVGDVLAGTRVRRDENSWLVERET